MKYAVVFASITGNTKLIGETIAATLAPEECIYCGALDVDKIKEADIVFVGFWTSRSSCSPDVTEFLSQVHNKKIALFGTCGFGGDSYYQHVLDLVKESINDDCTCLDAFICQGKMPAAVRKKYESKMDSEPEKMKMMIENFDRALSHPDENDVNAARAFAEKIKAL